MSTVCDWSFYKSTITTNNDSISIPLESAWTFWYENTVIENAKEYNEYIMMVEQMKKQKKYQNVEKKKEGLVPVERKFKCYLYALATVQDIYPFWSVFNFLPAIDPKTRDSIHIMKHAIKPEWEDPYNKNGGRLTIRTTREFSDALFCQVVASIIGQEIDCILDPKDEICGISLTRRPTEDLLIVWNKNADLFESEDQEYRTRMVEYITSMIPNCIIGSVFYKSNSDHLDFEKK